MVTGIMVKKLTLLTKLKKLSKVYHRLKKIIIAPLLNTSRSYKDNNFMNYNTFKKIFTRKHSF